MKTPAVTSQPFDRSYCSQIHAPPMLAREPLTRAPLTPPRTAEEGMQKGLLTAGVVKLPLVSDEALNWAETEAAELIKSESDNELPLANVSPSKRARSRAWILVEGKKGSLPGGLLNKWRVSSFFILTVRKGSSGDKMIEVLGLGNIPGLVIDQSALPPAKDLPLTRALSAATLLKKYGKGYTSLG